MNGTGDIHYRNLIYEEFVVGRTTKLSKDEVMIIQNVNMKLSNETDFIRYATQECKNQNIVLKFKGQTLPWIEYDGSIGPWTSSTEFGVCCMLQPHLVMQYINWDETSFQYIMGKAKFQEKSCLTTS